MRKDYFIITNNPMVYRKLKYHCQVNYMEDCYVEVLKAARDYVHLNHKLLTHPLAGSVKPNETPYKSIIISSSKERLNFCSLNYIESSINMCKNFTPCERDYSQDVLDDFSHIDYSLIESALSSILTKTERSYIGSDMSLEPAVSNI